MSDTYDNAVVILGHVLQIGHEGGAIFAVCVIGNLR